MGGRVSCWLLLTLSLKGVLAGDWSVSLPSNPISAVIGSSVVLPCSYDFPSSEAERRLSAQGGGGGEGEGQQYNVSTEIWCLENNRCITSRYVFHSAGIFPHPSYQNRVEYLQPGTKNCSLRISDLRKSDSGAYVFYLITSHPTQKMPEQKGVQLLVADSSSAVTVSASPSSDITEGVTLRLACGSPAASPQALFKWYKSTSSTPRHTGQVWDISEVTPGNSGSYYCQIQTGDKEQNSTMLPIDVEYSPRNTAVSVSPAAELQNGLPVTLTCSSDANPPVHTYTWYQGAACLLAADKSFNRGRKSPATPTGRVPTLSTANISAEEYGLHCCKARNRHGSQTDSVKLTDPKATDPSESSGKRLLIIGVTVCVILALVAIVAFLLSRRQKSSRHQSYVLTETSPPAP
ncbi:B-cell receptor CD22-like [Notothenia coriiceps]|uniref:B-cell receptor CD22 n=1 Tax=Notothenia coriiceps TaxID=8208 RepID=A0A6I9PRY8_9TELE|nr:PREDICTED: B-cell receptor CD22-like [Notothenia coriiceps]XP_010790943.1 PREDICTED: B-cell receptor CD22-like [Notothenia coriiceps]